MDLLTCITTLLPVLAAFGVSAGFGGIYVYRNSTRALAVLLRSAGTYILVLRKYKGFLAFALLTTFSQTLQATRQLYSGDLGWQEFGEIVLSEMADKFLSAAGNISNGLGEFVAFVSGETLCGWAGGFHHIVSGVLQIWTGVAAIYLMLFLYRVYRGRWQKADVDKHEQLLVVTILLLVTALLEGTSVLTSLLDHVSVLADVWSGVPVNETQNVTANASTKPNR